MKNKYNLSKYYTGITNADSVNYNDFINHINGNVLKTRCRVINREKYGIKIEYYNNLFK